MPNQITTVASGTSKLGFTSMIKFLVRNWYWVVVFLIVLPSIITSIKVAIDTDNPVYPALVFGLKLVNADSLISNDVRILKENPDKLVGMEHPEGKYWSHPYKSTKYYWLFFWNVIIELISNVWMITFPFVFLFKLFTKFRDESERKKNMLMTCYILLPFMLVINLLIMVYSMANKNILFSIPENLTSMSQLWYILYNALPLHGVAQLIVYLVNLFI